MTIRSYEFTNSAMLQSCSYDDNTEELQVTFKNGKTYTYVDVSKDIYDGLIHAGSAGKYFNSIKNGLEQK